MAKPRQRDSSEARANRHSEQGSIAPPLSEEELAERIAADPDALVLILDGIQDPRNLGACFRTADGAGVLAVVAPKDRAARLSETAVRVSCGGAEKVPYVTVVNLARAMKRFQKAGLWLVGTDDAATEDLYEMNLKGRIGIVLGAEEDGLRRLTAESCDHLVVIPMLGKVPCLNVSVATGVCLYEAVRQRRS